MNNSRHQYYIEMNKLANQIRGSERSFRTASRVSMEKNTRRKKEMKYQTITVDGKTFTIPYLIGDTDDLTEVSETSAEVLTRDGLRILDLVVAEWESDPMSVAWYDLRTAAEMTILIFREDSFSSIVLKPSA